MKSLRLRKWHFLTFQLLMALITSPVKAGDIPTLESLGIKKPPTFIEIEKILNTEDKRWLLFDNTPDAQAYINVKSVSYQPITKLTNHTTKDYLVNFAFIGYQPTTYRYLMGKFTINCATQTLSSEHLTLLKFTGEVLEITPIVNQPIKPNGIWEKAKKFVCPMSPI